VNGGNKPRTTRGGTRGGKNLQKKREKSCWYIAKSLKKRGMSRKKKNEGSWERGLRSQKRKQKNRGGDRERSARGPQNSALKEGQVMILQEKGEGGTRRDHFFGGPKVGKKEGGGSERCK